MEIYYNFIHWAAEIVQQTELVEMYAGKIMLCLTIIALLSCFFGFYIYRLLAGALTLTLCCVFCFTFLLPAWGMQKCVTTCAVIGVPLMVASIMWFKLDSLTIPGLMVATLVFQKFYALGFPVPAAVILAVAAFFVAGVITKLFPLWNICGITACWGAICFIKEGWRFMSWGGIVAIPSAMGLAVLGFFFQLLVYRRQRLFPKIMPQKMQDKWEGLKHKGGLKV